MKRLIVVFCIVAISIVTVCLLVYVNPSYSMNELSEKLEFCYDEIESVTDEHNLENNVRITDETTYLKSFIIKINDKSQINIEFSTNASETQDGRGMFSLSYTVSDYSEENSFDILLFEDLVNSISKKQITTEFLTDFLTSPEEKYSVEKYGGSTGDYAVEKLHALNFFEDWFIGFELTYDNHAELWFSGYIK